MAKKTSVFFCNNCGSESSRWLGKCPQCGEWNTFVEEIISTTKKTGNILQVSKKNIPQALAEISIEDIPRLSSGFVEVDSVLGGGIVAGALMLLGGDPGIGKSTLVMQISGYISNSMGKVLYASGEESSIQLKLRADRLNINGQQVIILADTNLDHILDEASKTKYSLLVIDSIQTMYTDNIEMAPGSVGQVRECTSRLLRFAKEENIPVVIIGHVTKDGNIAGPRMLEHMVDVVLYFEGERTNQFRVLRGIKNRFGSTSQTGIFSMEKDGLVELSNPSELLLADRNEYETGSAIMSYLEGVRPILLEAQSLVTHTNFGIPRRTSIGYDLNRLHLLIAVLEKKANLSMGNKDAYINVIGGFKISDPACDLAMAMALVSSYKDLEIPKDMVIIGEVGLTGNIRNAPRIEQRISEAIKLGFKKFVIPETIYAKLNNKFNNITLIPVKNIRDSIQKIFN